jgi:hypothetical protein
MRFSYRAQANPTSQQKPSTPPAQPQASMQASTQQQSSPYKAPDMSAYAQPSGGYSAYNVPRSAPSGAQSNDLSGSVPSNQVWGQAYNQAASQYGVPGATSFTMPGSFTSQSFNPTTGQYGPMSGGQSFDGNMAYNAIDSRPSPVSARATGLGGNAMPFQDSLAQREAFAGNLSQRLGQYSGGQLSGPVTFDPGQMMSQANDQLSNGAFYNPFSQQNPDVRRAMGNSSQYVQGNFQNPFGSQANVQQPSWVQQSYAQPAEAPAAPPPRLQGLYGDGPLASRGDPTIRRVRPSAARPIEPPSQGTPYNPQAEDPGMPVVPEEEAPQVRARYGYRMRGVARRAPREPQAPVRAPANMKMVPVNRRGDAARFGGMRRNGG